VEAPRIKRLSQHVSFFGIQHQLATRTSGIKTDTYGQLRNTATPPTCLVFLWCEALIALGRLQRDGGVTPKGYQRTCRTSHGPPKSCALGSVIPYFAISHLSLWPLLYATFKHISHPPRARPHVCLCASETEERLLAISVATVSIGAVNNVALVVILVVVPVQLDLECDVMMPTRTHQGPSATRRLGELHQCHMCHVASAFVRLTLSH
jgi:hypothetical protein